MPKMAETFSALDIKRLDKRGFTAVGGVAGLMLQISPTGTKSWVLRARVGDKRRDIGLGAYPGVTLAMAREKAQRTRDDIKAGIDPIAQRITAREAIVQQQVQERATRWTFQHCAEAYIKAHAPSWRNDKHIAQWTSTLQKYAYPSLGDMLVRTITLAHVVSVIEPFWVEKNETINRVRNRIELVLDWATAKQFRAGENPARWKGNLDKLLPKASKVAPVTSHRAVKAENMFAFMAALHNVTGTGARCLEFVVMTACRSGEARLATWDEIDFTTNTWHIPAERMKANRPHRVPLSSPALALLAALPRMQGSNLLFTGKLSGKPLSDMTMTKVMRDMGIDAVPHGFRATFSSWVASSTGYPTEVREMALAHAVGNDTVAAYQRSDLFEKRRNLMLDWARFVATEPTTFDNVIALHSGVK